MPELHDLANPYPLHYAVRTECTQFSKQWIPGAPGPQAHLAGVIEMKPITKS